MECSQTYSSHAWFNPRRSLGRRDDDHHTSNTPLNQPSDLPQESDPKDFDGFQFRLEDPAMMLPADELFSDDTPGSHRTTDDVDVFAADPYLLSPRAPRCSSRWKELLGFGKTYQSTNGIVKQDTNKRTSFTASSHIGTGASRSIRQFLHRSSKSANDASMNLPLLKDADNESVSVSVSSRPSLSSSSSGHDLDDLPRLSLDSDKPGKVNLSTNPNNRLKSRMVKTRTQSTESRSSTPVGRGTMRRPTDPTVRGVSVDSPRMNSSGKIVFHSLERSSSSPSSLNGGPRLKHRGMERSYSANVRVTPVLNVPVCSLRGSSKSGGMFGFPMFSSTQSQAGQKREGGGTSRSQGYNGKGRTESC
ncbi:uncharacterized protein LOC112501001 isoform X2 [Cynara cardunculus var. scolymus]|uniref:uncharacterized protein LOC112501001 isoform X2 n=1 Tax=Cynara cardunculus var. scolymus TaxID=59895 RepID=UPI000D62427B|nr:uncharacterized protein LOC112501001 isoform X2 [Cynara cardunculus var. scolymus]